MDRLKRVKKYKAETPERTITKVRSILCDKLGILLEEEDFKSEGGFYSTRVRIGNQNLSNMDYGTNGKGMTFPYALASAHGEFMERLENQAIILSRDFAYKDSSFVKSNDRYLSFLKKNQVLLEFQYAPDEEYIDITPENIVDVFKDIFVPDKENLYTRFQGKRIAMLPFYNLTKGTIVKLPYEFIFLNCTSNGMCAGNTPKEAIIQGLSEIIERYILREIYIKGISLPTIPDENFIGTEILSKIQCLKEKYGKDWTFMIKDCSLGKGYPAVGILMVNLKRRKYLFHLGVDPSPITALERSLTEIFQGREIANILDIDFTIQSEITSNLDIKDAEFYKTCTTGTGHYPISILEEPSICSFSGFDSSWGVSDDTDLQKLICLLENEGYEIYIRDVSFLEFPAFCIYIPGITEFRNIIKNNYNPQESLLKTMAMNAAYDLRDASIEQIHALIGCINNDPKFISKIMKYDTKSFLINYDKELTMGLLYTSIGEFENAYKSISLYYNRFVGTLKETMFFSALKDMLWSKSKNISPKNLTLLYDNKTLATIDSFMQDKNIFDYVPYKSFNNGEWNTLGEDHSDFMGMLHLMKRIENVYKQNTPKQESLKELLK
jgi:ribosomal protein S12 methylthiotransferase accessory factor